MSKRNKTILLIKSSIKILLLFQFAQFLNVLTDKTTHETLKYMGVKPVRVSYLQSRTGNKKL